MKLKNAITGLMIMVMAVIGLNACSSSVDPDNLPAPVRTFVLKYFQDQPIASWSDVNTNYQVNMKNGATLVFDPKGAWVAVNGNGSPLPEMMMRDELPAALFQYLEANGAAAGVYSMIRNAQTYKLTMRTTVITYTIATGDIKEG